MIGVMNSSGSQLSLFAMTILSLTRFFGIKNALHSHSDSINKNDILKMTGIAFSVIVASLVIALLPLLNCFEDFFVNGWIYDQNSLFIDSASKTKHFNVIQEYYGRMKTQTLRWSLINSLVDGMFSKNYGGIKSSKLKFYGNDAVCLFKYFVGPDDPQRAYVWVILAINIVCFVILFY